MQKRPENYADPEALAAAFMEARPNELRVIGPPGCGKTTWIASQLEEDIQELGASAVLVSSLTRAAAATIRRRRLPIPDERMGTLHSHCYKLLRRPIMAESRIYEWNRYAPEWQLSTERMRQAPDDGDDSGENPFEIRKLTPADKILDRITRYRVTLHPWEQWDTQAQTLFEKWQEWRAARGYEDFSGLIEQVFSQGFKPPEGVEVIYVDEAQDHSRLEIALLRFWSRYTRGLVIVGDPDQAIYEWRGAEPQVFAVPPLPARQRTILSQSYRLAKAPHSKANDFIRSIPSREPIEYYPTSEAGSYRRAPLRIRDPESVLNDARQYLHNGKETMLLAACSHMLKPILEAARRQGEPFSNPYRAKNGTWNPLRRGGKMRQTIADRILHFAAGLEADRRGTWTAAEMASWIEAIRTRGLFKPGAREEILAYNSDQILGEQSYSRFMTAPGLLELRQATETANLEWFAVRSLSKYQHAAHYAARVYARYGKAGLERPPRLIIGTIHSVKGGEAEVVYLFPDLSAQAMHLYSQSQQGRDMIKRLFYVGLTRAKKEIIVCTPSGRAHVPNL